MATTLIKPDVNESQLSLALLLYDGFTGAQQLVGKISVSLSSEITSPLSSPLLFQQTWQTPIWKSPEATYLFFGLLTGEYIAQVGSNENLPSLMPPYYLPADISVSVADLPVTVPAENPIWPAYPDVTLADSTKALSDPTQSPAYRAQRLAATLQPSTAYPFPAGSTLVRGTVFAHGNPLLGATVNTGTEDQQYVTGDDGEFVLFFKQVSGLGETITLQATHALHPAVPQSIVVHRGMTVTINIVMAP
jgi:hypothetical protein